MDLIAKLPVVAATIYNNLFREGATPCPIDPDKDWCQGYITFSLVDDVPGSGVNPIKLFTDVI
jgi:hypothetical protein